MLNIMEGLQDNRELRILIIEDSEDDEVLIKEALTGLKTPFMYERVYRKEEYIYALENFLPDIILSDYLLPAFDGLEALEIKKFYHLEIVPLIFVSGYLGEEKAVEAIKKGAVDFVSKNNLSRLPLAVLSALRESREKKKGIEYEVAFRQSEAKYRQLVEQAADGIFVNDEHLRFREVNSRACELLGYSKEELLQLGVQDIVPDGTLSPAASILALQAGETLQYEALRKRKNGTLFPVEVRVTKTTSGLFQAIMRDISRRKQVEKALSQALQRLEFYVTNSPLAILEFNSRGIIKRWTDQAERMFGWTEQEALGKHPSILKIMSPEDLDEVRKIFRNKIKDQQNHFSYSSQGYTKDGKTIYCEWYNSIFLNERGEMESLLSLVNNVTIQRLADEAKWEGQIQERKRIAREIHEGIGQMLVATKFKLASLDFSQNVEEKIEEMESLLAKTIDEVRRISLNMAPRSVEQLGIENAIRQLAEQAQRLTGTEISFHYVGQTRNADNSVLSSIYRLTQECLNNVIRHAHASKVTIELIQGERAIELNFKDNGKGFVVEEKRLSQGSGLGNLQERMQSLGGSFNIESLVGTGTSIFVKIPLDKPQLIRQNLEQSPLLS